MDDEARSYSENVAQELLRLQDEHGLSHEDAILAYFADLLADKGEVEDVMVGFKRGQTGRKRFKVNGYCINEEGSLDLFVVIPKESVRDERVRGTDLEAHANWLANFLEVCYEGLYDRLEPSDVAYDMCQDIFSLRDEQTQARFFLITDGELAARDIHIPKRIIGSTNADFVLWDIERFRRLESSGGEREAIDIDVLNYFDENIDSFDEVNGIAAMNLQSGPEVTVLLAVIPATWLYRIYERFGARLLERNVRAFLQARGGVNRGIRDTILNEPQYFSAYNNGLSCTADEIKLDETGTRITHIQGLQIVNGAQTTASIHRAKKRDGADIEDIVVMAKITVVTGERADELVPSISAFSNNQNRIQVADFQTHSPFLRKVEELSRTIWARNPDGASLQTRWFFERTRGQYADEKSKGTRSQQDRFISEFPTRQKFSKTDLAKYENSWKGFPYLVSRGAQKNFIEFMAKLPQDSLWEIGDFHDHIAKQILFRQTDRIVLSQKYGGYKAQVVTYTVALIASEFKRDINLAHWWNQQKLPEDVEESVRAISRQVFDIITNPPGGKNVAEYCKTEQCWTAVKAGISTEDMQIKKVRTARLTVESTAKSGELNDVQVAHKKVVDCLDSEAWKTLASFCKEKNILQPRQRGIAFSIGNFTSTGKELSPKMLWSGVKILRDVKDEGYGDFLESCVEDNLSKLLDPESFN